MHVESQCSGKAKQGMAVGQRGLPANLTFLGALCSSVRFEAWIVHKGGV
jgi:hypothetical protein